MAEQIYERAAIKKEVLAHLRQANRHQTAGQVTLATKFPFWAVEQVLQAAYVAKEAQFTAGLGWLALPELPAPVAV